MRLSLTLWVVLCSGLGMHHGSDDPHSEIDRLIQQLGSPRFRDRQDASDHLAALGDAAFGALRKALTGSSDPEVRRRVQALLDRPPREVAVIKTQAIPVVTIRFAPSGEALAWGDSDGGLMVWDTKARRLMIQARKAFDNQVGGLTFTDDSTVLAAAGGYGQLGLWSLATGKQRRFSSGHGFIHALAVTSDGETLFSSGDDKQVCEWNAATGARRVLFQHTCAGVGLAFSADNKSLMSVARRLAFPIGGPPFVEIKVLDLDTRKVLATNVWHHGVSLLDLPVLSPKARYIAMQDNYRGQARLWELEKGAEAPPLQVVQIGGSLLLDFAFATDALLLAIAVTDKTIRIWSLPAHREVATVRVNAQPVCLAIDSKGGLLASGNYDGTVNVWDISKLLEWEKEKNRRQ
jgi:WD40 repeat protein